MGYAGECVVFGEDADDGGAAAVTGDEGGGQIGDAGLDGEAGGAEGRLEESGAWGFFVADLGIDPDFERDLFGGLARGVDLGGELGFGFWRVGRRKEAAECEERSAEREKAEGRTVAGTFYGKGTEFLTANLR